MENLKFKQAVKIVRETIKNDSELYYAYQANIAMAFKDEHYWVKKKMKKSALSNGDIHEVANQAAKNFLNLWLHP